MSRHIALVSRAEKKANAGLSELVLIIEKPPQEK
jgi:hypothetical protein